jgi:uncharacterized protein YndB with AHSA1/START domain
LPTSIATTQINATAPEVYRYIATPHMFSEWVSGLRPEKLVGGDSEIRLEFKSQGQSRTSDVLGFDELEIIRFKPDHAVSLNIKSAGFIVHIRIHLFESAGITTVRQLVEVSYKRWYKMFAMLTNRMVHRKISKDLFALKRLVESEQGKYRLKKSA